MFLIISKNVIPCLLTFSTWNYMLTSLLTISRNIIPDMFADHIGNLTVELILASAEVK